MKFIYLFLYLWLSLFGFAFAQAPPRASDARLTGDKDRTRLIVDLSKSVDLKAFALADPYRIILDLDEVNFQFAPETGSHSRGLVTAWRYGLFALGKSRIVIDLNAPAKIDKAFILEAVDNQPARLVVDLVKTDALGFIKAMNERAPIVKEEIVRAKPPTSSDERPVVVLDSGHGGLDTGAVANNGTQEKAVVLAIARRIRDKLEASKLVRVVMTRDDDSFIPLPERVRIARDVNAALFVSLHADSVAVDGDAARGASIYTLSDKASDIDAEKLAEKENKSDAIAGLNLKDESSEVSDILIEFTQRETKAFSSLFARSLAEYMKSATKLHRTPLRSAGFRVLRAHDVPSVLLELGYISSAQDLKLLTSEDWRERTSDSIAKAILAFLSERKR